MATSLPRLSLSFLVAWAAPAIQAQKVASLSDFDWSLQNEPLSINIPAAFPSYAHLDLEANQVTGPLEYGLNDFNLRWIWQQNWTYSAKLTGLDKSSSQTFLLFNGLDTFASIDLCGKHVASTDNQFRQYYFNVTDIVPNCGNDTLLSLNFGSAPNIAAGILNQPNQRTWPYGTELVFEIPGRQFIRKQGNDFGWDWGPAYAPAGPWQPAYLIQMTNSEVHARNAAFDVYKVGQRSNLIPDQSQPWVFNASFDIIGTLPASTSLSYLVQDDDGTTVSSGTLTNVTQENGSISASALIENDTVELWWPVGMGEQVLYNITVNIHDSSNKTITSLVRRMGFRTIVLNQQVITEEEIGLGIAPGNHWHFEINGHPFYAKGSNFIPPDVFWPRVTPKSIRSLFNSVLAGNQNMLRVWSTGAYSPDFVYDIADELGILLWSEFEFGDCLYPADPAFLSSVYEEAVYNVRRVNHHPSLAYWAGGNEFENYILPVANRSSPSQYPRIIQEYEELFLSTLFPAVFENTHSLSYLPSSTSNGFLSLNFTDAPYMAPRYADLKEPGHIYGVTDYYNYSAAFAFNIAAYPIGRFANEFGFHSMPSLQTWSSYVADSELHFNSTTIQLRNRHYPAGGLNTSNFVNTTKGMSEMTIAVQLWYPAPNKTDQHSNFSSWCWTTQIFQADFYSSQIQFYKRGMGLPQRNLGSLYWQLEDQWAAPTWAGIERTGRWKVLHYRAKDLYKEVIISPFFNDSSGVLEVWATSELWESVEATVNLQWYNWDGQLITNLTGLEQAQVVIGALNSTQVFTRNVTEDIKSAALNPKDLVARASISVSGRGPNNQETETFEHTNWWHASRLSEANLVDPELSLSYDEYSNEFTVKAVAGVSAWTWLDYPAGSVVSFSDNGFWLGKGESRIIGYTVVEDSTQGKWIDGVTVQSIWNNTLAY
ncbi:uncharacterized protein JN550_002831 [Neoarthrinium moseri]|uniref:uncharacterized protein n=1 Tax=Neoarthrinium moseri TaxID=1658444 RepID=UPI001FDAE675|nr:uncharacterized protein JN550_002831 [Neoarthrinium moseri]KAI1874252.1 hypothetical protein JN550_002831 [Neoarthrinium moseri]